MNIIFLFRRSYFPYSFNISIMRLSSCTCTSSGVVSIFPIGLKYSKFSFSAEFAVFNLSFSFFKLLSIYYYYSCCSLFPGFSLRLSLHFYRAFNTYLLMFLPRNWNDLLFRLGCNVSGLISICLFLRRSQSLLVNNGIGLPWCYLGLPVAVDSHILNS